MNSYSISGRGGHVAGGSRRDAFGLPIVMARTPQDAAERYVRRVTRRDLVVMRTTGDRMLSGQFAAYTIIDGAMSHQFEFHVWPRL